MPSIFFMLLKEFGAIHALWYLKNFWIGMIKIYFLGYRLTFNPPDYVKKITFE